MQGDIDMADGIHQATDALAHGARPVWFTGPQGGCFDMIYRYALGAVGCAD